MHCKDHSDGCSDRNSDDAPSDLPKRTSQGKRARHWPQASQAHWADSPDVQSAFSEKDGKGWHCMALCKLLSHGTLDVL